MKTEKKIFKHYIVDKVPFFVAIILSILGYFLPHILDSTIAGILGPIGENLLSYFVTNIIDILLSTVLLILFTRWFYPEFSGFFKSEKGEFNDAFKLSLPFFIFWIIWFSIELIVGFLKPEGNVVKCILSGLNAGFIEEVAFRGLPVTLLLRNINKKSRVFVAPLFIGICFGAMHLFNLTAGEDPIKVYVTVVFAVAAGIVFGVIYAITGNLWVIILAHAIYDTATFICDPVEMDGFPWSNVVDITIMIVLAIIYIVILTKKKDESYTLWRKKWNSVN